MSMPFARTAFFVLSALSLISTAHAETPARKTAAEILKASPKSDWRPLDPQNTLVMTVNGQQVIMELAPAFAPEHAANIRTMAHEGYYDGLAVVRVQDNFVTQWGDPNEDDKDKVRKLGTAKTHLPAEFSRPLKGLEMSRIADFDGWAKTTGFADGMPVAADPANNKAWIPHCYGVIGAGRGDTVDSSNGSSLYVIIGQAPRGLDLNITVVGRVLKGMEALSALPRGTGDMGFYEKPEQNVPLQSVKLLADMPETDRPQLELMKTDSASFKAILEARRHAPPGWYVHSPEYSNVCNMSVPMRPIEKKTASTTP